MNRFFFLSWPSYDYDGGIARGPKGVTMNNVMTEIMITGVFPFEFELRDGPLRDYQANSLACPMMSSRLKAVIDKHLTGKECLSWIKVRINTYRDQVIYCVPWFKVGLDVIDPQKTLFTPSGHVIRAHLSLSKTEGLSFFPLRGLPLTCSVVVCEKIKRDVEREKLTGMSFSKMLAS